MTPIKSSVINIGNTHGLFLLNVLHCHLYFTLYRVFHDKCVKLQEVFLYFKCNKKSTFDSYQILNNKGNILIFEFFG